MFLHRLQKIHATEFPKGLEWLNGDSHTLKSLKGKVVLLDFWTYSCINCIRTFDHLRDWHKRYADKGLVIIGVHTPEFDFEKEKANVESAIKRFKIKYPVILDSDYKVWTAYTNRWWPRKLLLNKDGEIVYDHIGEGGYAETEAEIQKALRDIGVEDLPEIAPDVSVGGGICYRTTPETYLGFLRGRFGNAHGVIPGSEVDFNDKGEHQDDLVYLHGHWTVDKEQLSHTRALASANEYLALKYSGFSVNLVAGSLKKTRAAEVEIELDGHPLPEDMLGTDVEMKNGKAIVKMTASRMYNLVDSDVYHKGTLKLKTSSDHVSFYAFTFGGCKGQ
ncbi:redoxin family protein [Candidatus Uhrbacteria bacterium]|jgi:thiol-disulfide isomerase/thioredoxin|nr:redoxin family protein [Candidatus Uhrbacteria bacterium]MBT7717158.1 redoxin family protein [Candidatus Uhrbacteria bacterium]